MLIYCNRYGYPGGVSFLGVAGFLRLSLHSEIALAVIVLLVVGRLPIIALYKLFALSSYSK